MVDSVFQVKTDCQFEMRRKASFSRLTGEAAGTIVSRPVIGAYNENAPPLEPQKTRIFGLMANYTTADVPTIQRRIVNHVEYTLARTRFNFSEEDCYRAASYSIRDRLVEVLNDTNSFFFDKDVKRCYYLSLEYLVGRSMQNSLVNLDIEEPYRKALLDIGYNLEALYEHEHDAALGNGGLGRLAACFLDSMATLNYPCWGYGIRYTYGIFEQHIVNGRQVEHPDYWLVQDNPWEIQRQDIVYGVRFYGEVHQVQNRRGKTVYKWTGGQLVQAIGHDNPMPGFDTYNCNNLRLWRAAPSREFDFNSFNAGKYLDAIVERQEAECISAVLYPNDDSEGGKALRLKQQYFFCCATIQDVLRRYKLRPERSWEDLPSKMAIQLNDTHPTIAIIELMRILVDVEELEWDNAWNITRAVFNYTNHTVLPEALEKWPADLFGRLLPRHLLIINDINFRFLVDVRRMFSGKEYSRADVDQKISEMSVYAEGPTKMLRMANLAVIGTKKVNGVAALHSEIVKRDLFRNFKEYYDLCGETEKFINITNGVTPRRWIHCANRALSNLISEWLGCDDWLTDLSIIRRLQNYLDEPRLVKEWQAVKLMNKKRLQKLVECDTGVTIDAENMLFDLQVKRIHEYKRQALNCLYIIYRYLRIKQMTPEEREKNVVKRATMIGGKAAPGYFTAKTIIKMICNVASVINGDPEVSPYFKVVFLPNYNVSKAMIIIPAADINQQISTAGTEASGTSNMKFVMNGSLIVGTLDGATVEIREECGEDTVFLFGVKEQEVAKIRAEACKGSYPIDYRLREVFDWIKTGRMSLGDMVAQQEFEQYINKLLSNGDGYNGDYYLVCKDFADYVRANEEVDALYRDQEAWTKTAIRAASCMGKFSTDRTIEDYAKKIWDIESFERAAPRVGTPLTPTRHGVMPDRAESVKTASAPAAAEVAAPGKENVRPTEAPTVEVQAETASKDAQEKSLFDTASPPNIVFEATGTKHPPTPETPAATKEEESAPSATKAAPVDEKPTAPSEKKAQTTPAPTPAAPKKDLIQITRPKPSPPPPKTPSKEGTPAPTATPKAATTTPSTATPPAVGKVTKESPAAPTKPTALPTTTTTVTAPAPAGPPSSTAAAASKPATTAAAAPKSSAKAGN